MKNDKAQDMISDIRKFRRNQIILTIVTAFVNVIIVAVIISYYRLKEQGFCGYMFLDNEEMGKKAASCFYTYRISKPNADAGLMAMKAAGYGSNAFSYISRFNGEVYLLTGLVVIMALMFFAGIMNCIFTGRKTVLVNTEEMIEENYRLKEAIENEQRYNEKQYRKMQDFIENIAHQIKTPLAVIAMKLDLLKGWITEVPVENTSHYEKMVDVCSLNTFKIKKFIKKLLDISRIEAGKVIFADDEVEVDSLVLESINNSIVNLDKVTASFNDNGLNIFADEGWLVESLVNIIDNCGEYIKNKDDGRIYINVETEKDRSLCRITISDNGKGLSVEDFNNIFNRFETGSEAGEFRYGIGLNLSKLIIESHNGRIRAGNSERYGGAEFTVELPVYALKSKIQ